MADLAKILEAGQILEEARKRHLYGSRQAVEEANFGPLVDVVGAILEVLTPEQRADILRKVKL